MARILLTSLARSNPSLALKKSKGLANRLVQNCYVPSRSSGHRTMEITQSRYAWRQFKDMVHFYTILAAVPFGLITAYINIRANPELTEIPEGYEPRHWEYYKHPVTRFIAKYLFLPDELESELEMAFIETSCEKKIMRDIVRKVDKVARFHGDHRNFHFEPSWKGELTRIARDTVEYGHPMMISAEGHWIDTAYDPKITVVPAEGYKPKE